MPRSDSLDPPPYRVVNEAGQSGIILVCEHASNFIPPRYEGLGVGAIDLERHIAWDIGAEATSLALSRLIDAPLVLANYSRLLIDLNRPPASPSSIPVISERTEIPGNMDIGDVERNWRIENLFTPFHDRVAALLGARFDARRPARIVAMHSFTPVYKGVARPMHAGVLFRKSTGFAHALIDNLGGTAAHIAANEPYRIEDDGDYTIPVHAEARGLDSVLLEIRQDLITGPSDAQQWAARLAKALGACAVL